jgi:threonine dehydrogenase-like Zn-dependent dehydrogenase
MGLGCLQTARVSGAGTTIGVDINPAKLELGRRLGADLSIDAASADPVERVLELTDGRGVDVVFETAGGAVQQGLGGFRTLDQAARMVRDNGVVVGIALYGESTSLSYSRFRHRSIRYVFPTALTRPLLAHVVRLVASGRVDVRSTITRVLPGLESVPEAFRLTQDKGPDGLVNPAQVRVAQALPSELFS